MASQDHVCFSLVPALVALALPACSAFLRQGVVDEKPSGRTVTFPAQTGQYEAAGWKKTLEPSFVRRNDGNIELRLELSPHVNAAESYMPTNCDDVVVSTNDTDGVRTPVRTGRAGSHEVFIGVYAPADLSAFATGDGGTITFCNYAYRFGGNGLAKLMR